MEMSKGYKKREYKFQKTEKGDKGFILELNFFEFVDTCLGASVDIFSFFFFFFFVF